MTKAMAELERIELKSAEETRSMVESSLRARRQRESRFRAYGIAAIAASVAFVAFFFVTIVSQGHSAFVQTFVQLDIDFDPVIIDPDGGRDPQVLSTANYKKLVKQSMQEMFPDVSGRKDTKALSGLVSTGAVYQLREMVLENPRLVGTSQTLWFPADDEVDMFVKGRVDAATEEKSRRFKDNRIETRLYTPLLPQ